MQKRYAVISLTILMVLVFVLEPDGFVHAQEVPRSSTIQTHGLPATPSAIWFTYVPPYGAPFNPVASDVLRGKVRNVISSNYYVVCYIRVGAGWWIKPTYGGWKTLINPDGSWACDVVTGGIDQTAIEMEAYLIANSKMPSPPPPSRDWSIANAVARAEAERQPPNAQINVLIGGTLRGTYMIPTHNHTRPAYPNINNGPVKVLSTNGVPVVASERVAYSPDNGVTWTSYSEMMGLPNSQLATCYNFPWYNNIDLDTQLRFANVASSAATVHVTIGGTEMAGSPFTLAPGASTRKSFAVNSGPVKIESNVKLVASGRVAYFNGSKWTSFSELMGLPCQSITSYIFPWYNNKDINTQLRFANVGNASTTVTVTIGGTPQGSYPLAPDESTRVSYAGLDNGPVLIQSSGGVPIIASERVAYFNGSKWTDFSELMGLPATSLSTRYSFSVYDNVELNSQIRFANVGIANTAVTVKVNGIMQGTYPLAPNQSTRVSYSALNGGPVVVESSGGVPIIASLRVAYFNGSKWTSFSEMMGLPKEKLDTTYWFPWYNNVDLNTQLRFGIP